MDKPDFDYYRMVVSTQNDPDILQSELKDLINESVAYIEKDDGSKVPCSVGLEGLLELAENWEQSAKDREASYEKDGNHFYKGASGVYASCAEALRLLIAEAD